MRRPDKNEYSAFYETYISEIENDPLVLLEEQAVEIQKLLGEIDEATAESAYEKGKWTIKEVLGHLMDSERVFAYRAMSIARKEKQSLPGFEQDDYVAAANFNARTLSSLIEEFLLQRKSTLALLKSFDEDILNRVGNANNSAISVLAILYILAGHEKHHIGILKERYLK